jgi:5-methylthioribose kinase
VGKLKARFQTHSQALIHGDLHTGSIFVNEQGLKVIDPEFAFYGPMGYDVGNVIANLIFAWGNRLLLMEEGKEKEAFLAWVESAVVETYDLFKKKAAAKLEGTVTDALLKEPVFLKWYIGKLMADSMGYAGTELHRRTVGDAKVAELTGVQDEKKRAILERLYIDIGVEFIKHRSKYKHGKDLVPVFQAAVEKHFPKK